MPSALKFVPLGKLMGKKNGGWFSAGLSPEASDTECQARFFHYIKELELKNTALPSTAPRVLPERA